MNVLGTGPTTATWAIVGEAPGATEDKTGVPFVGPSGQLLRKSLSKLGLDPADAFITNVVQVRPPNNATPTAKAIREAAPRLAAELAALPNLQAVLLLGNTALQAASGKGGVTKRRGLVSEFRDEFADHEASFFATLHPAMVLRNNNYQSGWLEDLASFQQLVNPPEENVRVVVLDTIPKLPLLYGAVKETGALDIETTIPGTGNDQLISVAVTFDGETSYVLHPEVFRASYSLLKRVRWTMHNGAYDRGWLLQHEGLDLILEHDTMAMQYLLNSDERKGLQYLSSRYLGLPPYKDVDYKNILSVPFRKIAQMNGVDAARTLKLFRPLADELNKQPQLSRLYQWVLMPAVNTLIEVSANGVPVDEDNLDDLTDRLSVLEKILGEKLISLSGKPDLNPRSTQQIGRILYEDMGLRVPGYTATGAPSTASPMLKQLAGNTFVNTLLEHRKVSKQLSAFLNAWPEYITDGRMHPEFKPLRVVTGRLSSANPNIQQVPRDKEFRNVFGGLEGHSWIKADYSQIELRLAAWLAGEPTMLEAYRKGDDLHTITAMRVLGDPAARQVGKTLNFGLLYGAGPMKLKEIAFQDYGIRLSDKQAREYREGFFDAYPYLREWHRTMAHTITRSGKSVSPTGRVRHLPDALGWDEALVGAAVREGINHPVQGFASDLMLHAVNEIHARYPKYVVAIVHDEVDLVVPDEKVEEVSMFVKETMENTDWLEPFGIHLTVPLVADLGVGTHWGSE